MTTSSAELLQLLVHGRMSRSSPIEVSDLSEDEHDAAIYIVDEVELEGMPSPVKIIKTPHYR